MIRALKPAVLSISQQAANHPPRPYGCGALGERARGAWWGEKRERVCLPFILTRGLLWFWPEQSRINGRDTRVPEALQCKQFELANTPMKSELYLGLDVDKEWIVSTVAEWGPP